MNILEQMLENLILGKDGTPEHLINFKRHTLAWLNKDNASLANKQINDLIRKVQTDPLGEKELTEKMDILKEIKAIIVEVE
jgi:hypothetical protein